ncbi:MAG TPA: hypothetical protein VHE55_02890 [Fimbriimonadaceae bacterium]|nr:hypothetical protein [Fimbriimonadaceae bacterium]
MTPLLAFILLAGPSDLDYLRQVAREVTQAAVVKPGGEIANAGRNTTGFTLRVPGGTQTYYPAFWIRDAAMMLGADLVPADEIAGWIKVVAAVQPGPGGLDFPHGLHVPPYSIPDHITLQGVACWYPGAYAEQGVGDFGYLPPADDAFYFIQMVYERYRLTRKAATFSEKVKTGWGEAALSEVSVKAFDSVAADPATGLVLCDATPGKGRVDWGFCDSISKTGSCLMPSLLRWQAARRLAELFGAIGQESQAKRFREEADRIRKSVPEVFYTHGSLVSATGLGRKDDVWGSAFAVWLGILPRPIEQAVSRHLVDLYRAGGTVVDGQVRGLPPDGALGGYWEKAKSAPDTYQNGGYWATPTGWFVAALRKTDRKAGDQVLGDFVAHIRAMRAKGAPFEWINPKTNTYANGNYGSSAGLVYAALN